MNRHCTALLGLALACGVTPQASAAAAHKWIDADGVTHYSDKPPNSVETTLIELPERGALETASENGRPVDDYYSISNQWQRMNQERVERERLALEWEKLRAAQQTPAPAPVVATDEDEIRYVPVYAGFGFHRPHHRHHRHGASLRYPPQPPAQPSLGTFPTR